VGLFTAGEPLDTQIATVLLTKGRNAQRALAKGQSGILAAMNGDPLTLVVVDEITGDTTVAVAGRHVHVFRKGGKLRQRVVDAAEIEVAFAEGSRVSLDGIGVSMTFQDRTTASTFAAALNKIILHYRPRAVPTLYPQYYLNLLAESGVQATTVNVSRLIERTAFIIGLQGAVYCAQLKDPQALEELISRFASGGPPDRQLQLVDDIVDWLWAWNPGCHKALERQIHKWRDGLLAPGTFLTAGRDIPPWDPDSDNPGNSAAWRIAYAKNLR
jgi:hypothetical protein